MSIKLFATDTVINFEEKQKLLYTLLRIDPGIKSFKLQIQKFKVIHSTSRLLPLGNIKITFTFGNNTTNIF